MLHIRIKSDKIIHQNSMYVYFLKNKKVFRGTIKQHSRTRKNSSAWSRNVIIKPESLKEIKEIWNTCSKETVKVLEKRGIKVITKSQEKVK